VLVYETWLISSIVLVFISAKLDSPGEAGKYFAHTIKIQKRLFLNRVQPKHLKSAETDAFQAHISYCSAFSNFGDEATYPASTLIDAFQVITLLLVYSSASLSKGIFHLP
jgi:hypothetical protein